MVKKKNSKTSHRLFKFRRRTPPGAPPGTIVVDSESKAPLMRVIAYGIDEFVDKEIKNLDEIEDYTEKYKVLWLNIDGLGDLETITTVGKIFGIHRLTLEDIVNPHQRPKTESYEEYEYVVLHMINSKTEFSYEQVSLCLGENFLITFQDRTGDVFDTIRDRIRKSKGRIRRAGPAYLAYALIDTVIDNYFPLSEEYARKIEMLEHGLFDREDISQIKEVHDIRSQIIQMNRTIFNHSEIISALIRNRSGFITEETSIYFRDCYDHTQQLLDFLSLYRETAANLINFFLSLSSHRSNEIMKFLTIIASIFIPLTFIAGVYGMNFNTNLPWNMPELNWTFGYPFALLLMAASSLAMIFYFYKKRWIFGGNK